jgi:hypothetical protein
MPSHPPPICPRNGALLQNDSNPPRAFFSPYDMPPGARSGLVERAAVASPSPAHMGPHAKKGSSDLGTSKGARHDTLGCASYPSCHLRPEGGDASPHLILDHVECYSRRSPESKEKAARSPQGRPGLRTKDRELPLLTSTLATVAKQPETIIVRHGVLRACHRPAGRLYCHVPPMCARVRSIAALGWSRRAAGLQTCNTLSPLTRPPSPLRTSRCSTTPPIPSLEQALSVGLGRTGLDWAGKRSAATRQRKKKSQRRCPSRSVLLLTGAPRTLKEPPSPDKIASRLPALGRHYLTCRIRPREFGPPWPAEVHHPGSSVRTLQVPWPGRRLNTHQQRAPPTLSSTARYPAELLLFFS